MLLKICLCSSKKEANINLSFFTLENKNYSIYKLKSQKTVDYLKPSKTKNVNIP